MVPTLLLTIAADCLIAEPSRPLAWRLLHDAELWKAAWLRPWLPVGAPFDRDPLALLLAGGCGLLAAAYLAACISGLGMRLRAALVGIAVALVVLFPTALYVSVGAVTSRPFGQDGGVVQLPLALEHLLAFETPYGADYSDSMLGKQSRASAFWRTYGGNPIVRHHAYLPGTHVLMLPFYLLARVLGHGFDSRVVTFPCLLVVAWLASRLFSDPDRRLVAAALVALNPLVYWQQAFGANDILFVGLLLGSAVALSSDRRILGGTLLGLACATKQLAWPYLPFLLLHASGARSVADLKAGATWRRLRAPAIAAAVTFAAVVAPVVALSPRAFFADIFAYNMGLGGDAYPFGGTPGYGFANLVLYFGGVHSLRDAFPFGVFYVPLLVIVVVLLRAQLRRPGVGMALAAGSVALLFLLYFSRVAHPNYLIGAAILLPIGILAGAAGADVAVAPLLLFLSAVTILERGAFRSVFEDLVGVNALRSLAAPRAWLRPRAAAGLTDDPFGLFIAATAAGVAVAYAVAGVAGVRRRWRMLLIGSGFAALVLLPTWLLVEAGAHAPVVRAQEGVLLPSGSAGREAWPTSFRLEPPAVLDAKGFPLHFDGRWLSLAVLALFSAGCARAVEKGRQPAVLTAVAFLPSAALGVVFGSPALLGLVPLATVLLLRRRHPHGPRSDGGCSMAIAAAMAASWFFTRSAEVGAGLGLVNVASYFGLESVAWLHVALAARPLVVVAFLWWVAIRRPPCTTLLSGGALTLLGLLLLAHRATPFDVSPVVVTVVLSRVLAGEGRTADGSTGAC